VFDLVPPGCNKHISSIYSQLGRPQIDFDSFWDVYNQLRDAVDAEFLFHSSTGAFPEEHTGIPEDVPNVAELQQSQLRPCQFGKDAVPAEQIIEEGEADHCLMPPLTSNPFSVLRRARVSCRAQEGRIRYGSLDITYTSAHISLDGDLSAIFTDDDADEIY